MSINTLNTKFKLRRDTLENWTTNNPTIAVGEPILVYDGDDTKIKIGKGPNGSTFNNTEYYGGDWNSLLNKPFYTERIESQSYTADYDAPSELLTDDQEQILYASDDTGTIVGVPFKTVQFRKVPAYTAEQLKSLTISYGLFMGDQLLDEQTNIPVTDNLLIQMSNSIIIPYPGEEFPVFFSVFDGGDNIMGLQIPDAGFYGIYLDLGQVSSKGLGFTQPEIENIYKLDPKYIDKSQLNFSWNELADRPFGDLRYQSFSISGISNYEDLILSSQAPSFDQAAGLPENNGIYRLGDYIPFTNFGNSSIMITQCKYCEYQNEDPANEVQTNDFSLSSFDNADDGSYTCMTEDGPILFGVPTDDYTVEDDQGTTLWEPGQAGIYIICYEKSFTTDPISGQEKEGTLHEWVSGLSLVGNLYTKLMDQKYLPNINYSKINDTPVSSFYYSSNNQETFYFSNNTEISISISNSDYYYSLYDNDINLSEADLLTSIFSDHNNQSLSLTSYNLHECIVDKTYEWRTNATIYYIYFNNNNKQKDYADVIYIKTYLGEGSSVYCSLYDKNNNVINQNTITSDKLYLLRWPDENDNSIICGITSMRTGSVTGKVVKKLHPNFLPSYILNKGEENEEDNGICKWIDYNTIFTPNTGYGQQDKPLKEDNYYKIYREGHCKKGISLDKTIINNSDVINGSHVLIRFEITINHPDTLYIKSDNFETTNNAGRIAISYVDQYLDFQDLSSAYINGDYSIFDNNSSVSFNMSKGTHTLEIMIYSNGTAEDDDYIELYLDAENYSLDLVQTLTDFIYEQTSNLSASQITDGTLDFDRLPNFATKYDLGLSNIDFDDFIIISEENSYNTKHKYYRIKNLDNFNDLIDATLSYYYKYHTNEQIFLHHFISEDFNEDNSGVQTYTNDQIIRPILIDPNSVGGDQHNPINNYGISFSPTGDNDKYIDVWAGNKKGVYILEDFSWFNITKNNHFVEFPSWEELQNKPFYENYNEIHLTASSGNSQITMTYNNISNNYQRIGNYLSKEELSFSNLTSAYQDSSLSEDGLVHGYIRNSDVKTNTYSSTIYYTVDNFIDSSYNIDVPLIISTPSTIIINGTEFTEGTWVLLFNSNLFDHTNLSLGITHSYVQTLNEKYIPDSVKYQVPPATSNNEGAVLRVVNGAWTAVQLPSASGQSF